MSLQPPAGIEPRPDCEDCQGTGLEEDCAVDVGVGVGIQRNMVSCECLWRYERHFDLVTDETLQEMRGRVRKATPGLWVIRDSPTILMGPDRLLIAVYKEGAAGSEAAKSNTVFISRARQDLPILLDEVTFQRFNARAALQSLQAGDTREAMRMLRGLVPEESVVKS